MTLLDLLKLLGNYGFEVVIKPEPSIVGNAYTVELIKRLDNSIHRQCFTFDLIGCDNADDMVEWMFLKNIRYLDGYITKKY